MTMKERIKRLERENKKLKEMLKGVCESHEEFEQNKTEEYRWLFRGQIDSANIFLEMLEEGLI